MDFAQGVGTFQAVVLSVQEIFVGVSWGEGMGREGITITVLEYISGMDFT